MKDQSLQFMHRLNDGGLLYVNRYLERRCGCTVFQISPSDRLIYAGEQQETVKNLKRIVLRDPRDQQSYYDAEHSCFVYRYLVNEYRNYCVFYPVKEKLIPSILEEIGEILVPLGYHLKGLYYSHGNYKLLLQNQAGRIFRPDSGYWESLLHERMADPDAPARVIVFEPVGGADALEEYRHLLSNLALRYGGNDILTCSWAGRVVQIVPLSEPAKKEAGKSAELLPAYPVHLFRELLKDSFSVDFRVAIGQACPLRRIYHSYLSAMMTDFYLYYFRREDMEKRFEDIPPSKWFSPQLLEQALPELEKKYSPLNRYESERSGYLFTTIRELVRAQFNYQDAARNLHIHLNTLYYRQEKLSELFSVDFAELETKIVLYHDLFAYDFARFLKECEAGT